MMTKTKTLRMVAHPGMPRRIGQEKSIQTSAVRVRRTAGAIIKTALILLMLAAAPTQARNVRLFGPDQPMAPIVIDRAIDLPEMDARQQRALSAEAREQRQRESLRAQTLDDLAYRAWNRPPPPREPLQRVLPGGGWEDATQPRE